MHLIPRTTKSSHYAWPGNYESHLESLQPLKQLCVINSTLRTTLQVVICQICPCCQVQLTLGVNKKHICLLQRHKTSAWGWQQLFRASEPATATLKTSFDTSHTSTYKRAHPRTVFWDQEGKNSKLFQSFQASRELMSRVKTKPKTSEDRK